MSIELNALNCTDKKLGTGLAKCIAELGFPKGFIRVADRNWSADIESDTFDKDYFTEEMQKMNFIPFVGSADFESNTADPTNQESANGLVRTIRNGKPQMSFTYWRGFPFYNILTAYNSYGEGGVILVFEKGILVAKTSDNTIQSFNLGMQNTNTFSFNDGSNGEQVMTSIQLEDENQFALQGTIITNETLGFNPSIEINGVIDANIVLDTVSAGTDITASITATTNSVFLIKGLTVDSVSVVVNGVRETPTAITFNDATNKYDITTSTSLTASDEVFVEIYDTANDYSVANEGGQLYRGKSATSTVS